MAGNTTRKRKLLEQFFHSLLILRDAWIELAVRSFEICISYYSRSTMPRPSHVDDIQIMHSDQTIKMHIEEVQTWCRAPVPE